jgi:hypothetical protein
MEERVVSASKEFRDYADECLDWARTAKSEQERDIYLRMARTWFAAAVQADLRDRPQRTPPPEAIKPDSAGAGEGGPG